MTVFHPLALQKSIEQVEQQVGFTTSAQTGNHLYQMVVPMGNKRIQIRIS